MRPYKPYICQTIGELNDKLGWMMLNAPTFKDHSGYFPDRDLEITFKGFNESLSNLRSKLGDERYEKMRQMSDQMRALFESDPDGKTGGAKEGCKIIYEMEMMLRRRRPAPKWRYHFGNPVPSGCELMMPRRKKAAPPG